jgi:hypothetical protein
VNEQTTISASDEAMYGKGVKILQGKASTGLKIAPTNGADLRFLSPLDAGKLLMETSGVAQEIADKFATMAFTAKDFMTPKFDANGRATGDMERRATRTIYEYGSYVEPTAEMRAAAKKAGTTARGYWKKKQIITDPEKNLAINMLCLISVVDTSEDAPRWTPDESAPAVADAPSDDTGETASTPAQAVAKVL